MSLYSIFMVCIIFWWLFSKDSVVGTYISLKKKKTINVIFLSKYIYIAPLCCPKIQQKIMCILPIDYLLY